LLTLFECKCGRHVFRQKFASQSFQLLQKRFFAPLVSTPRVNPIKKIRDKISPKLMYLDSIVTLIRVAFSLSKLLISDNWLLIKYLNEASNRAQAPWPDWQKVDFSWYQKSIFSNPLLKLQTWFLGYNYP